jgi:hypothetical protein
MKNHLNGHNVVEIASAVAIAYVASQAVVASVRTGQIVGSAVKEFRLRRNTPETTSDES